MKKVCKMIIFVVSLLLLAMPLISFAETEKVKEENEKTKKEVQKLEEVVVEANKTEKRESIAAESTSAPKLEEFGHNVEIITGEEMKEAGFVDLDQALEAMVPGFFSLTRSGRGGYNKAQMQGSGEILLLLVHIPRKMASQSGTMKHEIK